MNYLSNAFALSMLPQPDCFVVTTLCNAEDIPSDFESFIGHTDLANIVSNLIDFDVIVNRTSLKLNFGDVLYVAQYIGPRLPEGTQTLPEDATINFYKVVCAKSVSVGYEFPVFPEQAQNDIDVAKNSEYPSMHFFDV